MCGNFGTYEDVVTLPLSGRCHDIDRCIHTLVAALNAAGIETLASCCGHRQINGRIDLDDGRVLIILPDATHAAAAALVGNCGRADLLEGT